MSLYNILEYVSTTLSNHQGTVGESYGAETFCILLYSLLKMNKPKVVVELGVGGGVTSCLAAQALKENGVGMLWGVDDGSAWNGRMQSLYQEALGYSDADENYSGFIRRLFASFELEEFATHVDVTLVKPAFFAPNQKIDVLFADAASSSSEGCIQLLCYYLHRMHGYSSIFIDRASTINHSYLLLNYVVSQLNRQKLPLQIRTGLTAEQEAAVRQLMSNSHFTIVHLTEHGQGKLNFKQNSLAWIKIEPCDYLPQNSVLSFDGDGKEIRHS